MNEDKLKHLLLSSVNDLPVNIQYFEVISTKNIRKDRLEKTIFSSFYNDNIFIEKPVKFLIRIV